MVSTKQNGVLRACSNVHASSRVQCVVLSSTWCLTRLQTHSSQEAYHIHCRCSYISIRRIGSSSTTRSHSALPCFSTSTRLQCFTIHCHLINTNKDDRGRCTCAGLRESSMHRSPLPHRAYNVRLCSQYWKSNAMHWCDICKCWMNDTKQARLNHERGAQHQAKLEKSGSACRVAVWAGMRRAEHYPMDMHLAQHG